jgi:sortase A
VRRKIQVLGWTLIWSGIFIFGYLGWQLFGTGVVNAGVQEAAQEDLRTEFEQASVVPPEVEQIDPEVFLEGERPKEPGLPTLVDFHPEEPPERGEELAFLRIPKIAVDEVLFEGVDRETLKNGPGHMNGTPIPGQPGNAVISGHRTTHGSPFFDFDLLEQGDRIEVETSIGEHIYEIREIIIVEPTDVWVTDDRPGGWLTLTTCEPKFSARQRLIVFAEMVSGPNLAFIDLHKQKFS